MVTLQAAMMAMLLSNPGQIVLLDFYSDACSPCRAMQPTIQALETKGFPVQKVNINENRELTAKYKVQSVPCYVMVVDGKEVDRVVGGTSFSRLEKMFKVAAVGRPNSPNNNPPGGSPFGLAAIGRSVRNSILPGSASSAPPSNAAFDPNVAPASFQQSPNSAASGSLPMAGTQNLRAGQSPANNFTPPVNQSTPQQAPDAQLIAASVRLRVEDPSGHSCGSGTIIDARDGKALILTCGHLFRDSQGKGKIEVDLFGPYAGQRVEGRLESFDADKRDIGLVSIQVPGPISAARLAPPGYKVRKGDAVASVGCDKGADATARRSQVTSINRYQGSSNLQVAGQPVEGRSGGGLFSAEGYVIGVCNARDPKDQEGLYAAMEPICEQLDQVNLAFVYKSPQGWEKSMNAGPSMLLASGNAPAMPSEMPRMDASLNALGTDPANTSPVTPVSFAGTSSAGMNAGEQAALDEIHRHLKDGAEVVCVIRPRNTPGAKSEIIMLDKASPEFVKQITSEAQTKDVLQQTSLEVARPRKKILEWSIDGTTPQIAP